jgi:hypothetical protein
LKRFFSSKRLAAALTAGVVSVSALVAGTAGAASATVHPGGTAGHAPASPARPVADSWITGLPAHVRRGSTVTFTLWYRVDHTHQSFLPVLYGMGTENSGAWGAGQYRGVSFQFYDVMTHRWEGPMPGGRQDPNFQIGGNHGGRLVGPGALGHVTFRMHVGRNAYLGHWRIAGSVTGILMPSEDGTDGLAKLDRFTITR